MDDEQKAPVCIDCGATNGDVEQARKAGWGWSYGGDGTLWVCPPCLDDRRAT